MGGRGAKIAIGSAGGLNKELIKRANNQSSAYEMGDSINREYENNIKEIRELNISETEKQNAIKELTNLSNDTLKAQVKAPNPYTTGRAKFDIGKNREKSNIALEKREAVKNYMEKVRKQSATNKKANEQKELLTAMQTALKDKKLEFTINGKTWKRNSLRSKSFYNEL